ncbi:OTU deubiquitinase with linear linkage specificity a [Brachyhypopomus gauderio]|uniref:OTU deubiquitinase with linear linkage specificity a n=1 Tax=Brachyhypopomus gauderio TaxID=698409 RepID=UPI004042C5BF
MSWVTAVPSKHDVFDEDTDDLGLHDKEWRRVMEKRTKDGFRDGLDAGKEEALQLGFNLGFREGAGKIKAVAQLKGVLSAVRCWTLSRAPGSSALSSITELLRRVERHEEDLMEAMRKAQEQPPVSVSEVSGDMEELAVGQGDQGCSGTAGGRDGDGPAEDAYGGSVRIVSRGSLQTNESLDQLLHSCTVVLTELGLPEELTLHVQQLRCT